MVVYKTNFQPAYLQGKSEPQIMVVNSSPDFDGIDTSTGLDVAGTIIDYIAVQVEFPTVIPNPRSDRVLEADDKFICYAKPGTIRTMVLVKTQHRRRPETRKLVTDNLSGQE